MARNGSAFDEEQLEILDNSTRVPKDVPALLRYVDAMASLDISYILAIENEPLQFSTRGNINGLFAACLYYFNQAGTTKYFDREACKAAYTIATYEGAQEKRPTAMNGRARERFENMFRVINSLWERDDVNLLFIAMDEAGALHTSLRINKGRHHPPFYFFHCIENPTARMESTREQYLGWLIQTDMDDMVNDRFISAEQMLILCKEERSRQENESN